jgi:DNA invertase Pin-like site-specific DNA recombinase
VVIGEPHRAFYGNQYSLTLPIFDHYGVPLWVPEVGGPIDPANEAHDLVMSVFGGMSKGERNRVKIRVRTAMTAQAQIEGRFLGGRPPYGYMIVDAGPHLNPAKAADGKQMHKLALDPEAAPVVARIFAEFLAGHGIYAIAEGLTRDGIPSPSAHDPARNTHRSGIAWSKDAVRAILTNPRYTGYQVWNRQRTDEVLLDIENVALGHTSKMRWNLADNWVFSEQIAHLRSSVRLRTCPGNASRAWQQDSAQAAPECAPLCTARRHPLRPVRTPHGRQVEPRPCLLRLMVSGRVRASEPRQPPKNVYLQEADVLGPVDDWLARLFGPVAIGATLSQLTGQAAQLQDPAALARAEAARPLPQQRGHPSRGPAPAEGQGRHELDHDQARPARRRRPGCPRRHPCRITRAGRRRRQRPTFAEIMNQRSGWKLLEPWMTGPGHRRARALFLRHRTTRRPGRRHQRAQPALELRPRRRPRQPHQDAQETDVRTRKPRPPLPPRPSSSPTTRQETPRNLC